MARPTQSESTTAIKQALAAARQSNEVELTAWLRHHLLEHQLALAVEVYGEVMAAPL